jgi:colicin import membrane protein
MAFSSPLRALGLALLLPCMLSPGAALAQDAELNTITAVNVRGGTVEIVGTKKPNFTTFTMTDPARLVIDISEAVFSGVPEDIQVGNGVVTAIRTASYGSDASAIARVLVGFDKEYETDIQAQEGRIVVKVLGADAPAVAGATPASGTQAQPAEAQPGVAAQDTASAQAAEQERMARQQAEAEAARAAEQERQRQEAEAQAQAAAQAQAQARAEEEARAQAETAGQERKQQEGEARAQAEAEARRLEEEARAQAMAEAQAKADAEARARADAQAAKQAEREEAARRREEARAAKEAEREAVRAAAEERRLATAEAKRQEAEARAEAAEEARQRREEARAARAAGAEVQPAAASGEAVVSGRRKTVALVGFAQEAGASRVFIRTDAPVQYSVSEGGERTVVVELENTRIGARNNQRPLETAYFETAVARVVPRPGPGRTVRVEISLKEQVPYQARQDGNVVSLEFPRPGR